MGAGYGKSTSMSTRQMWWINKLLSSIIIQTREGTWGLGVWLQHWSKGELRWPLQWWVKKHFPEDTGCASHFLQSPSILWSGKRVSRVLNLSFNFCVISQLSIGLNLHFSLNNIWHFCFCESVGWPTGGRREPGDPSHKRSWQLSCWCKNYYYTYAFSVYSYSAVFGITGLFGFTWGFVHGNSAEER